MEQRDLQPESGGIDAADDLLDSWKEIAAHLKRDVSTVQRWERREAMPVHRHQHGKLGSVYAFRSELDAWRRGRRPHAPEEGPSRAQTRGPRALTARAAWRSRVAVFLGVFTAGFLAQVIWSGSSDRSPARRGDLRPIADAFPSDHSAGVTPADYEYHVGRYYMWRYDEENLRLAIRHFERATQIDPAHAPAFAALSNAWWARGMFGAIDLRAAEMPARRAADATMTLDAGLAAAYVAQADIARIFDKDPAAAEQLLARALALDPDSVEAHHSLSLLLMGAGRFVEALAHIERAATLRPLAPAVQSNFGRILYRAGRFAEAVPRFERALELEPGMRVHYIRLGDVYDQMGLYEHALDAYARSGTSGPVHEARVARVLARTGRSEEARLLLRNPGTSGPGGSFATEAASFAALGDTDTALGLLARMIERDDPGIAYFPVDPQFASLRAMPQWPELLRRVNFPAAPRQ